MEILIENVLWMVWNAILAILPVLFAFLYFKTSRKLYKVVLAILWFLFFPNALYVISDIEHIVWQWPLVSLVERLLLLVQYIHLEIIGLIAFIVGLYALERELRRHVPKQKRRLISVGIVTMNFLIGFAMVLGKIERVNSWDVFTNTDWVIESAFNVLSNDQLVWLAILFGLFGNFFYFLFRDPVIKYFRNFARAERLTNARGGI